MSFQHNHSKAGIRHKQSIFLSVYSLLALNTNIYNIAMANLVPTYVPTAGDLLVINVGGVDTRTCGTLAGWTKITRNTTGNGTAILFYKIADGSEVGATYTLTWAEGALRGGFAISVWNNVDTVNPLRDWAFTTAPVTGLSLTLPVQPTPIGVITLSDSQFASNINNGSWLMNNGFENVGGMSAGASCYYKVAERRWRDGYGAATNVWFSSSVSHTVQGGWIAFNMARMPGMN